ncbi:MAG: hypothetical protein U0M60_12380, partial [Clostridia bacterium]|nr:hypothetical protein [Clostridia bacterium]
HPNVFVVFAQSIASAHLLNNTFKKSHPLYLLYQKNIKKARKYTKSKVLFRNCKYITQNLYYNLDTRRRRC